MEVESLKKPIFFVKTRTSKTDSRKNESPHEPCFCQIASQLRPLIILLQTLGGYQVAKSKKILRNLEHTNIQDSTRHTNKPIKGTQEGSVFCPCKIPISKCCCKITSGTHFSIKKLKSCGVDVLDNYYETATFKSSWVVYLYSYFYKALAIFCIVTLMCNLVLRIPYPVGVLLLDSSAASKNYYFAASLVASVIMKLMEITVLYLNCNTFVQWLNNWSYFEREFWKFFSKSNIPLKFNIQNFRNTVITFYVFVPILFWIVMGYTSFSPAVHEFLMPVFGFFICVEAAFTLWFYVLVEDVKVFIIFKTTVLALKQIRKGIQNEFLSENCITPSTVVGWRSLVQIIRDQNTLVCSCLKAQQILIVAECIIACTTGLSSVLNELITGSHSEALATQNLIGTFYFCLNNLGRLYLKVLFAEKIPAEELLLARDLLEIDADCCEFETRAEIKFLHNLLTQKPTDVNLGNYFTLDKKILLTVGVQVVTYLIVIMQFQQSADSASKKSP